MGLLFQCGTLWPFLLEAGGNHDHGLGFRLHAFGNNSGHGRSWSYNHDEIDSLGHR